MTTIATTRKIMLGAAMALAAVTTSAAAAPDEWSAPIAGQSVNLDKGDRLDEFGASQDFTEIETGTQNFPADEYQGIDDYDAVDDEPVDVIAALSEEEIAALAGEEAGDVVILPASDTPEATTNFADPQASESDEYTYSQAFLDRTGRRIGYLWDVLSESVAH
jgi:hypothetical protein